MTWSSSLKPATTGRRIPGISLTRISHQFACRHRIVVCCQHVMIICSLYRHNKLRLMRPRLSFCRQRARVSLRPSLGATLRAAVAVQIVCPDNLSLNQSYGYAFGSQAPAGGTNLPGADLDVRRTPAGCAPWKAHITNPARSSHQLVRNPG